MLHWSWEPPETQQTRSKAVVTGEQAALVVIGGFKESVLLIPGSRARTCQLETQLCVGGRFFISQWLVGRISQCYREVRKNVS